MIEIEHLDKFYGKKQALSDVSLTIEKGMFGLLGRNGAGKTTLMKVLATLSEKQGGNVTVRGKPDEKSCGNPKDYRAMPQEFSMYPNMNVYDAMDYLGVLSGLGKKERKQRIPTITSQK